MNKPAQNPTHELSKILLEVGALLMASGANTARIRTTIMRIAGAFGYNAELLITHRALMLTIFDNESDYFHSSLKRTSPHGANFKMVSGLSRMSWHIVEGDWSYEEVWAEINRLKAIPHYPRWIILSTVALAGASFCRVFGGGYQEMLIAFVATFAGLFVRQEAVKKKFNAYMCIFFASLTSCLISGATVKLQLTEHVEFAFATSVLYLIPGIPLINSLSDLLEGNIMNGLVRGMNGLIIAFGIALGMLSAILIYNI